MERDPRTPLIELPVVDQRQKGKPRDQLAPGENLCDYCTAKCCQYIALQIDTPTDRNDFETLRWFMYHQRVGLFVDDGDWYLIVYTPCRHVQPNHRCGVYETRPQICRDYTTDNCEYDDSWVYDQYFETPEQLEEYIEAVLGPAKGKSIRSRPPHRPPSATPTA